MSTHDHFSPTSDRLQDLRIVTRIDEHIEEQMDDLIELLATERGCIDHAVEPYSAVDAAEDLRSDLPLGVGVTNSNEQVACPPEQASSSQEPAVSKVVDLTFVLPCRDQAHELADSILRLQAALERIQRCGEIMVVDLGSSDDSVQIARELGVRVIQIQDTAQQATGLERLAGREVLKQARGQVVILSDCAPENVSRWF